MDNFNYYPWFPPPPDYFYSQEVTFQQRHYERTKYNYNATNQQKEKLKREKWLAIRYNIKKNRKRRRAEMRERGEDLGPTRKSLKMNTMENSSCKIKVALDLSFDEYMTEKDIHSLTSQLQFSYSANRRAKNPLQFYICNLGGKTKRRLDEIGDYERWNIYKETKSYEELFPKESLVYLSSESPNVLTTLSEDKVYIIGGLVDHNRHKGLCRRIAEERGIVHAQLPITQYLEVKSQKVLAINNVFSILLRYTESSDWKAAYLAEMTKNKQTNSQGENTGSSTVGSSTFNASSSVKNIISDPQNNPEAKDCSSNKPDYLEAAEGQPS